MSMFEKLGTGQGYLKAGLFGFAKSGKTYTGMLLAIGVHKLFGCKTPIVMFDTESGSEYISELVRNLTGQEPIGIRSRSFDALLKSTAEIDKQGIEVFVVDSITHPWRELCDGYLASVNEMRRKKNLPSRGRLEFQDWNPIKSLWAKWADWYLNSKVHVIICGRAGNIYEFVTNEETQRKELTVTGVKMKTETEFGFEPSLLVEMERTQQENGKLTHTATVVGDRFGLVDGHIQEFVAQDDKTEELQTVMKFFMPHLKALKPGAYAPVDTTTQTTVDVDEEGRDAASRYRTEKDIFLEEIQAELLRAYPGQTAKEKAAKADICGRIFNTRSWTKITTLPNDVLQAGLKVIRSEIQTMLGDNIPDEGDFLCTACNKSCKEPPKTTIGGTEYCPHCLAKGTLVKKPDADKLVNPVFTCPDTFEDDCSNKGKELRIDTDHLEPDENKQYICPECGSVLKQIRTE